MRRGGAETGGDTESGAGSRLRAVSTEPAARCGARTHGVWDRDLSRSRPLNWLSHPGAPNFVNSLKGPVSGFIDLFYCFFFCLFVFIYFFGFDSIDFCSYLYYILSSAGLWYVYFWERVHAWVGEGKREREGDRGSEVDSALTADSPMWGLNSQTMRSWPELKSDV